MNVRLPKHKCSARVPRVQFGVPPNCGGACGLVLVRPRMSLHRSLPISGGTPETARGTRVLQPSDESARYA
jgi:hypothetical protein